MRVVGIDCRQEDALKHATEVCFSVTQRTHTLECKQASDPFFSKGAMCQMCGGVSRQA
jgi:hypothetical protein